MKLKCVPLAILIFCSALTCTKSGATVAPLPTPSPFFAKGADLSWGTQMENWGIKLIIRVKQRLH